MWGTEDPQGAGPPVTCMESLHALPRAKFKRRVFLWRDGPSDDERYATNRGRRDNKTAIKADMERVLAEFGLEAT